jgi:hypothetical protein
MKRTYRIVIYLIAMLITGVVLILVFSREGCLVQRVTASASMLIPSLAALLAVTIALSNGDPPRARVSIKVEPYITTETENWRVLHKEEELAKEQKDFYGACPKPIVSYKVQYRMTNNTGSVLRNPVATFWLPLSKQAPNGTTLGYRSNTYNSPVELRILEMVDGVMISNSNLPYWPSGKSITLWFRMVLENGGRAPFPVEVSVNADNADGWSQTITVEPETLLRSVENAFPAS